MKTSLERLCICHAHILINGFESCTLPSINHAPPPTHPPHPSYSKGTETENHCLLLCLYCKSAAGLPRGCSNLVVQSVFSTRFSFSASSVRCLPEGPSRHIKDIGHGVKIRARTKLRRSNEYGPGAETAAPILISQASSSSSHDNEYLMHSSLLRTLSLQRF